MRMRKVHLLAPILILATWQSAASQSSGSERSIATARSAFKLKSVDLDNKYTIEVPDDFTVNRIPDRSTSAYKLSAPSHDAIQVFVLPYSFVIPIDEKTGLFKLPVGVNGSPPMTAYFKIREGLYAYYGWNVTDEAYECTANSPCPHPTSPEGRYATLYAFAVFDKPNNSVVELTVLYFGPSKEVTGFEGDGKLLRDVIVPSLTPIH